MSNRIVKLLIVSGLNAGTTIEIIPNSCISFGRNEKADWIVDDSRMSSLHFEVENLGDRVIVRDQYSNGGTRLNKSLVIDEMELTDGDEISAGLTTFRVESLREENPK